MTGLPAAEAFDATLVTGGLPITCARWRPGEDTRSFLTRELPARGIPAAPVVGGYWTRSNDVTAADLIEAW